MAVRIQPTDCGLPPSIAFHAAWSLTAGLLLAIAAWAGCLPPPDDLAPRAEQPPASRAARARPAARQVVAPLRLPGPASGELRLSMPHIMAPRPGTAAGT